MRAEPLTITWKMWYSSSRGSWLSRACEGQHNARWCRLMPYHYSSLRDRAIIPRIACTQYLQYMIVEFEGIFASWHIICGPLLQVEQYSRRWSLMRSSLIITLYHQDRCVGAHQGATAQCWYQVLDVVEENGQSRGAVWVWMMMSEISLRYVLEMEVLMWSRWRSLETVLTYWYRYFSPNGSWDPVKYLTTILHLRLKLYCTSPCWPQDLKLHYVIDLVFCLQALASRGTYS